MKKLLALGMVTGLVLASVASASAQQKAVFKATSKSLDFYLHWDDPNGDCAGPTSLDLEDHEDTGQGCGYAVQLTGLNEVLGGSGQGYLERIWGASDGVPFVLDASKPIKGVFQVNGWLHPVQVGNAILDVTVSGMSGSRSETLASLSQAYTVTPAGGNVIEFSVKPPKKLNGKKFTSLAVTTNIHGMAVGQHFIDLETNPAHITVQVR